MQLYETSCIQNIVKIQMNISVYFPRDFLSPSLERGLLLVYSFNVQNTDTVTFQ